ncbi:MAG: hypothetical protein LBO82_07260 [Synergistaceae bacterium]|jgi:hypothetical protein|nr:hypothetical protein [Synergistaceae bacterium]
MTGSDWRDVILFGQVLSAGLVVGGYILGGVCAARWMAGRGFGSAAVAAAPLAAAFFGLWQGWLFLSRILERHENDKKGKKEKGR